MEEPGWRWVLQPELENFSSSDCRCFHFGNMEFLAYAAVFY